MIKRFYLNRILVIFAAMVFFSCEENREEAKIPAIQWGERSAGDLTNDSLILGSTYLPVYSEIYDITDKTTHQLTATVSIRNTSRNDSVYITLADYYNTSGDLIRSYVNQPVYIKPMETLEIIIARTDTSGGSGANFLFEWATEGQVSEPLFEAVMIWTTGTQGISFATRGVKVTGE